LRIVGRRGDTEECAGRRDALGAVGVGEESVVADAVGFAWDEVDAPAPAMQRPGDDKSNLRIRAGSTGARPLCSAFSRGDSTVQRINTHGGVVNGVCDRAGAYQSATYSADYVFLRKGA
jgi:hypothetical protein